MNINFLKAIHLMYIACLISGYNSTEKVISYYEQHNEEFNFDGIFGLIPLKALSMILSMMIMEITAESQHSNRKEHYIP
ncbi:unnamed protein product [Heterobilharzia americana]|nr:unnamed protein product [Heterobilharzia americana]